MKYVQENHLEFHLKRAGTRGTHNINKGTRNAIYAQTYTVFVLICEIFLQIRHLGYDFVKFRTTQVRSQFRYAICVPQQTGSCFNFVTTYDRNAVPTLIIGYRPRRFRILHS
jgi:hypothetical protein